MRIVAAQLHASGLHLEFPGFPGAPGWAAGFTTRQAAGRLDPVLPLLGWQGLPILRPKQQHGRRVLVVKEPRAAGAFPREADGLATACRGLILTVASADCVPLVLFDPVRQAGAVLHAGWRGTCAAIAGEGTRVLNQSWGCRAGDLLALLGPCIGPCCYQVGSEVVEAFAEAGHSTGEIVREDRGRTFLDLPAANQRILERAGVPPENVVWVGLCTRCRDDLFPSFRREGPAAGRLLAFLGSSPPA